MLLIISKIMSLWLNKHILLKKIEIEHLRDAKYYSYRHPFHAIK